MNDMALNVIDRTGTDTIAARLGLHKNTVQRWMEQGRVPAHYESDFLRMENGTANADDQFYTNPDIARHCLEVFGRVMAGLGVDSAGYTFIEPSAGSGVFYCGLPPKRRIGLDIAPQGRGITRADFLTWQPARRGKYMVIGNPPFGLRGHLALSFINHSAGFADAVAFILPQLFESDGKGAPSKRVDGRLKLAHSARLPAEAFHRPNGEEVNISTIFQVWSKIAHDKITRTPRRTCKSFARLYSLSDGGTPASTRNRDMLYKCDVYLPSTCFAGMHAYDDFESLPHRRGYGVVIHKQKRAIKKLLRENNWEKTAFPSTNGALNLRFSLIEDVITKGGYYDD